ncbi:MAG: geranylgeranyl reductase family protein [Actinobacteria bacterium]|nr:geranylgeranyl reductase family protein [Actinomycetota bacterium]
MTVKLEPIDEAEVVIVGAGPAGTAAAITLSRLGRDVVLIDQHRFPRDKPCGDGLWSGAVEALREFGLAKLIDGAMPIEKTQIVHMQDERLVERLTARRGPQTLPRCIPRQRLDAALLDLAIAGGARFTCGRAQEFFKQDGSVTAITVRRADGSRGAVHGRAFIAADGATSRLRRLAGVAPPKTAAPAYAIRQYVGTDRPLEPIFEIRTPIAFGQHRLPGYSWIFPVDENIANIGVGLFRGAGSRNNKHYSLRELLRAFTDELRSDSRTEFGDLDELSPPQGAPLAIGFAADSVQKGNIFFVGDAARLTDPLVGEGISAALESGRITGDAVDGWLDSGRCTRLGDRLSRRFPRIGQDTRLLHLTYDRLVDEAGRSPDDAKTVRGGNAFLEEVATVFMRGSDDKPVLDETPVVCGVAARDDGLREIFTELNRLALDEFRVDFPFAFEMLHRRLRSTAGPSVAAGMLLTAKAHGLPSHESPYSAAIACELTLIASHFLGQTCNQSEPDRPSLGNGLTTLIADLALSTGLQLAVSLGPAETAGLARLSRTVFEGAMSEAVDTWRTDRSAERYFAAAHTQSGEPHAFAVGLGARLAKYTGDHAPLNEFGQNLGLALKISNDVVELFEGDEPMAREPGDQLRMGNFTLATIFALEKDPDLAPLLTLETVDNSFEEALARIRATGAIKRSFAECVRFAETARAALEQADLCGTPLESLINLAVDRHRGCLTDRSEGQPAAT